MSLLLKKRYLWDQEPVMVVIADDDNNEQMTRDKCDHRYRLKPLAPHAVIETRPTELHKNLRYLYKCRNHLYVGYMSQPPPQQQQQQQQQQSLDSDDDKSEQNCQIKIVSQYKTLVGKNRSAYSINDYGTPRVKIYQTQLYKDMYYLPTHVATNVVANYMFKNLYTNSCVQELQHLHIQVYIDKDTDLINLKQLLLQSVTSCIHRHCWFDIVYSFDVRGLPTVFCKKVQNIFCPAHNTRSKSAQLIALKPALYGPVIYCGW